MSVYLTFHTLNEQHTPRLCKWPNMIYSLQSDIELNYTCVVFLGVYGDVHRVKILFNKKDTALIQFNDTAQSQTCM